MAKTQNVFEHKKGAGCGLVGLKGAHRGPVLPQAASSYQVRAKCTSRTRWQFRGANKQRNKQVKKLSIYCQHRFSKRKMIWRNAHAKSGAMEVHALVESLTFHQYPLTHPDLFNTVLRSTVSLVLPVAIVASRKNVLTEQTNHYSPRLMAAWQSLRMELA